MTLMWVHLQPTDAFNYRLPGMHCKKAKILQHCLGFKMKTAGGTAWKDSMPCRKIVR